MKTFLFRALLPLILALYALCAMLTPHLTVSAQSVVQTQNTDTPNVGDYACILSDDVYFYLSPNGKDATFLLPKTYYVRLLAYGATYCKIEYLENSLYTQKLTGYARTESLTFVDYAPARPYLNYVFDVIYRLENATPSVGDGFTELTFTCAYYGDYPIGDKIWCYVLRDGEFGYVPKPDYLEYEENTEYAEYLEAQTSVVPDDSEEEPQAKSNSPAQIAILIALCLLVPILAALILKPKSGLDPD